MIDRNTPTLMLFGPTQDCGCPMEQWLYQGITIDMHFEANGCVDVHVDGGDWDRDLGEIESREAAFAYVDALPMEE